MEQHAPQKRDTTLVGVNLLVDVHDAATGELLEHHAEHNLVTLAGRNLVRDLLNEGTDSGLTHLAVGSGTTAAAAEDTALVAEVARDTFTKRATTDGVLTLTYFLGTASANGSTLTEAGLFNAGTAGTLFARAVHDAIAKSSSVTITYTWQITIGAA